MFRAMRPVKSAPKLNEAGVKRALERLRALVKERGLKASRVRESIARAALSLDGHFTIEQLVERLSGAHVATVYRVLPLLVDAGLLRAAPGAHDQGQRYERPFEREHHDHLVCTSCDEGRRVSLRIARRQLSSRHLTGSTSSRARVALGRRDVMA